MTGTNQETFDKVKIRFLLLLVLSFIVLLTCQYFGYAPTFVSERVEQENMLEYYPETMMPGMPGLLAPDGENPGPSEYDTGFDDGYTYGYDDGYFSGYEEAKQEIGVSE